MKKGGSSDKEIIAMMDAERERKGKSIKESENGRLTDYGLRKRQLELMLAGPESPEQTALRDIGNVLYRATAGTASPKDKLQAKVLTEKIPHAKRVEALRLAMKRNGSQRTWDSRAGKWRDPFELYFEDGTHAPYKQRLDRMKLIYD